MNSFIKVYLLNKICREKKKLICSILLMGSSVCQRLFNNVSVCSKLQKKIGMKHGGKGQNYLCKRSLDSVIDYMIFFVINNNNK